MNDSKEKSEVDPKETSLPPMLLQKAAYLSVTGAGIAIILAVIRYILCGC